jgi:hypothetical protein
VFDGYEGLILTAGQFLAAEELADYRSQLPTIEWFAKQREALGVESYLYTFIRIAGAESVRQWGFDETKIDGHDTFNQWAMLKDGNEEEGIKGACIVTLELAAVLPSSEALDVVGHIEEVWKRGKEAVDAVRAALGPELQGLLCPLRNGGVSLHKLYGVMHDTCNCANLVRPSLNPNYILNPNSVTTVLHQVAKLMLEVRERKCRVYYGADNSDTAEPKAKNKRVLVSSVVTTRAT